MDAPERTLSERIRAEADSGRMGRRQKRMLHEWADKVAALEQENEDLRLGYIDLLKSKAANSPLMARIAALEQERDEAQRALELASDDLAFLDQVRRENARLREELEREIGFADRFQNDAARLREAASGYARVILECEEHEGELCSCCVELLEWCRALAGEEE